MTAPINSPSSFQQLGQENQPSYSANLVCAGRDKQTQVQVLIDSGNSLEHYAAITLKCAEALGLTLQPCNLEVNTADWHHKMKPCGQITNPRIAFPGKSKATPLKSVLVLPDLKGYVNLGYKFLQRIKGDLSFEDPLV